MLRDSSPGHPLKASTYIWASGVSAVGIQVHHLENTACAGHGDRDCLCNIIETVESLSVISSC